jgi:hypothetical protein
MYVIHESIGIVVDSVGLLLIILELLLLKDGQINA